MAKHILDSLLEKFMRHVEVSRAVNRRACWIWIGSKDGAGYGTINRGHKLSPHKAHRVAWILAYGELPDGKFVCHKCDNPSCVRPAHLFLGSQADNMDDCSKKGRVRRKITPQEAWAIRHAPGKHREIASQYGICKSAVTAIKLGNTWKNAYP